MHPLRLRVFLSKLAARITRAELDRQIATLSETRQEICRTVHGPRWLPATEERAILETLGSNERAYLLLEETGFDVFSALETVARLRPASDSMKELCFRLPAFVALVCTHLSVGVRVAEGGQALEFPVYFHPPFGESPVDILFLWGYMKALLFTYRIGDYDLALSSTALKRFRESAANNFLVLRLFHGSLDQVVSAHRAATATETADPAWAEQVKSRTANLLQEQRELLTAVEYLNMANDELERKILSNQRELDIARNIQKGFVPENVPAWKGLQFRARFLPLREVSGDFYDYFTLGSNKLGFLVCDVSGHGVPAALISAIARLSFHNHRLDSPSEVFAAVNRDLLDYVRGEGFVAAFFMIIDSEYHLTYSRAGIPAPLLLRARTGEVEELASEGIILGMFPDAKSRFRDGATILEPGDKLFMFTDGLTEATDRDGHMLGEPAVRAAVLETMGQSADEACDHLGEVYRKHILGADPKDDVTIVVVSLSNRLAEFDELLRQGRRFYHAGDMVQACQALEDAIAIFPQHPSTLLILGRYLTRARRFREAMEFLFRYNRMKPYNADAYRILAECAYHQNNHLQASEFLKKALSLRPEFPAALYLSVLVQLKLLNFEKALAAFASLQEIRPEHPRVLRLKERLSGEIPAEFRRAPDPGSPG